MLVQLTKKSKLDLKEGGGIDDDESGLSRDTLERVNSTRTALGV